MKNAEIKNEHNLLIQKNNLMKIKKINIIYPILIIFLFIIFFILFFVYVVYRHYNSKFSLLVEENETFNIKIDKQKNEILDLKLKINQLDNQLIIKKVELNNTISYYLNIIKNFNNTIYKEINSNISFKNILLNRINITYKKKKIVNINEIEANIKGGRKWEKFKDKKKEINIGFQLDPSYILRTMMTLASIIDSQKLTTKLRLHFAVVLGFTPEQMLKIYSLRERLRDDVEFNFYNAEKVENDFKGMHPKGPGAIAKILLPHLLPDDIERLLVFDTGDVLIIRDLSEMYNWNIDNYLYMGIPDPCIGKRAKISKKQFSKYINIGNFLLNVKKIKSENMYEKYLKYKKAYTNIIADQDLLNDVAQEQIGYLPIKYGIFSPFINDKESDNLTSKNQFEKYKMNEKKLNNTSFYIPKNSNDFFKLSYNPVVIHQWNGKWQFGSGLSIYRRLAQTYIRIAGIWDELCLKKPGYCKK